jgi:hypothetical protein
VPHFSQKQLSLGRWTGGSAQHLLSLKLVPVCVSSEKQQAHSLLNIISICAKYKAIFSSSQIIFLVNTICKSDDFVVTSFSNVGCSDRIYPGCAGYSLKKSWPCFILSYSYYLFHLRQFETFCKSFSNSMV